ncbi:MAG: formate/nitrite transporter family protein [Clostridia bacterium]|nr:formate/nitrite transporter family protein [Clostridia bacterium]
MLSSSEIERKWETIARRKASLSIPNLLLLGILAGMFIAFGALGSTIVSSGVGGGLGKLLGACVFPCGLMLVVMAGAELFTGNCLMAGPALNGKVKWTGVLKNWLLVYLGNMCGAFLFAWLVNQSGLIAGADLAASAKSIATNKCALTFGQALLRGIACNILVCGAVWMASGAQNAGGKAALCFFPVMLFVVCGFEHSVANMYYVPLGMLLGAEGVTIAGYLLNNLLPVTLGNIIGGAGLAVIYAAIYRE